VVGDAARLFDPADSNDMRSAIESVLGSQSAAFELKKRGRIRSQEFSWRRCAENTVDIYRRLLTS
jgi:glycosyltransferase involved in cell wall biosynthesis